VASSSAWPNYGSISQGAKGKNFCLIHRAAALYLGANGGIMGNEGFGFLLWILLIVLYFLPIYVGATRNCKAISGIGVVNVFLGWTFVGWVVALAWAACGETKSREINESEEKSGSHYQENGYDIKDILEGGFLFILLIVIGYMAYNR
jgi:hypothetical protein